MGGDEDVRGWSEVPTEILGSILSKLFAGDAAAFVAGDAAAFVAGDAAAFGAVCKAWRSTPPPAAAELGIPSDEQLSNWPCLIFPDKRFFHPLTSTYFRIDTTHALPPGIIITQNYGWLLIMNCCRDYYSFFFNPFTGDRIDLPVRIFDVSNFSAPPTSPDCVVFSFQIHLLPNENDEYDDTGDQYLVVNTIKRGEDEDSEDVVCSSHGFDYVRVHRPVFFRGEYYALCAEGNLAIYNPNKTKHRRTGSAISLFKHFSATDCRRYVFEGEGHLWAVFTARGGREVCVCKLNMSRMVWEKVDDLGDRMVFVSDESCLMERAKVRGGGNKIYFPRLIRGRCMFYSLATKRYHTFDNGPSYDSFHGSTALRRCTWIRVHHTTTTPSSLPCLSW